MKTVLSVIFPTLVLLSAVITYSAHGKPVYEEPSEESSSSSEEVGVYNATNITRKEL